MKFWNNSKSQTDTKAKAAPVKPEDLEQKLENMRFQARPAFREDLKERLLQRLDEPAQPKIGAGKANLLPGLTPYRHLPSRTRLALGSIGLAALLVVLFSVLSVSGVYRNPTAPASVAPVSVTPNAVAVANPVVPPVAAGVPGATPGPASGTNPGTTATGTEATSAILAALHKFFDPAETARTAGFTVNIPGYLPAGYQLTYAAVANPTATSPAPNPPANGSTLLTPAGYSLRFSDLTGQTTVAHQIELAQWQVPFTLSTIGVTNVAQGAGVTGPNTASYQSPQTISIAGQPAFVIEGSQWQIQLATAGPVTATVTGPGQAVQSAPVALNPVSVPISGTTIITSPVQANGPVSATLTAAGPVISFTQVGTLNTNTSEAVPVGAVSGGIVVAFSAQDSQIRTLVWQQNAVFTVLTAPVTLSEVELKQIAESLKPAS
jgi:hypothetical protein